MGWLGALEPIRRLTCQGRYQLLTPSGPPHHSRISSISRATLMMFCLIAASVGIRSWDMLVTSPTVKYLETCALKLFQLTEFHSGWSLGDGAGS